MGQEAGGGGLKFRYETVKPGDRFRGRVRGDLAGTLRRLEGEIRDNPSSSLPYSNKAAALADMGRLEEAEECCRKALSLDEGSDHAHETLGLIMRRSRRPAESIQHYDTAIRLHRRRRRAGRSLARMYSNKGSALMDMDRAKEALRCFERSIRADPSYAIAHGNRGAALYGMGRTDEAAECFLEAAMLDPGYTVRVGKT